MALSISPIFIAIFSLFLVVISFPIGPLRGKVGIQFWGGEDKLDRLVRGQGNFVEYVPLFLLSMVVAETLQVNTSLLWGLGVAMVVSRLVHYIGLIKVIVAGRLLGTLLTLICLVILAVAILLKTLSF